MLSSNNMPASKMLLPSPGFGLPDSDPILMPSQDSRLPVGTIRSEVGSQRSCVDQITATPHEIKSLTSGSEVGNSTLQGKAASFHVPFSIPKPSSNYNDRPQQAIGPQKGIIKLNLEFANSDDFLI
uniref:uncharacterized protein LOC122592731 n=1 Tax=Erigeron canadensis TaxID=72917 RepID=UPI001CB9360D|nr:uncharacterized protein LOC122592731 [Erigeron canadensis]